MSEAINENVDVYNHYLELSKPTKEDFERVFTEEELKELCLRHKCSVDMYRWNVVNDYRILFTESGRFQRWSERDRLRMLAKAVNKMKPSVLYDDKEISEIKKEEWGMQLKENILSLNFWHRKRADNTMSNTSESDEIDKELQSQCEVNTESMNMAELHNQIEPIPTEHSGLFEKVQLEIEIDAESMNLSELQTQLQLQQKYSEKVCPQITANVEVNSTSQEDILLADFEEQYSPLENSNDSAETVLLNRDLEGLVSEVLHSEEVAPEIQDIYDVNTMSMTIDSEMYTQSQDLPIQQSEDVIPTNYDNFKNIIPLTSTQSQNHESGDIEI